MKVGLLVGNKGPIDIHLHWCVFGRPLAEVVGEMERLESLGYDTVVVYPLPAMGAPPERAVHLIPGAYREMTGIDVPRMVHDDLETWLDFLPLWGAGRRMKVLSFLDVRAWDGRSDLDRWWGAGHAGLKNILIDDSDGAKMRMPPLRLVPGISREEYFQAQREVFSRAARGNLPFVYHADLSLHHSFVTECLEEHPELKVSIPHLGFSRKAMAKLIERFPGVMTDISSLKPYIDADPGAYRSFMTEYPDRVMLGSDAIACHDLAAAFGYVESVKALKLDPEVEERVLRGNAAAFLGT